VIRLALSLIFLLQLSACSGMLYYPTRHLHFDPAGFKLKPDEVFFKSADGTRLFAWRFATGPKPKGVFVLYHGNGENLSSHYITMLWALPKGYDLFTFDYRGYGRSEGEPSPEGTVRDGEAALRWVHQAYPQTPIIIVGQSLGGAIALRNAIDLKGEIPFRAVVIEGSFPSYRRIGQDVLTRAWFFWPFQWLAHLALSDRYAPDGEIGRISPIPMLVLHAEGDQTVPFKFGEEIFWQAGEPRELWKVPGTGHTDAFLQHGVTYSERLLAWLSRYINTP
jgi:fermentation-respiration switch protein FrsA (DUF1100 family)